MNNTADQLDVIVRFHDLSRVQELKRCLFSLVGQRYRPLNIILQLQRFSPQQVKQLHQCLQPLLLGVDGSTLELHNWQNPEPTDARGYLLQAGIEAAKGRFLAFLDYDDVLYPEAYQLLIDQLRRTQAAIVFARVQPMTLDVYPGFCYTRGPVEAIPYQGSTLRDLFDHNFCPLHSYLFDRQRIPAEILQIDTSLTIEEDYELLLRVCAICPADFGLLNTTIGTYYFKTDDSNTVATAGLDSHRQTLYTQVCHVIEKRRRTTFLSSTVQRALGFPDPERRRSIRQALQELPQEVKFLSHIDANSTNPLRHRPSAFINDVVRSQGGLRHACIKAWSVWRLHGFLYLWRRFKYHRGKNFR